eukprot:Em0002g574a
MRVLRILVLVAFIAVTTARFFVHNRQEDATISDISNSKVKLLVQGIKESFSTLYENGKEFVVLCLVPQNSDYTYGMLKRMKLCVYQVLDEESLHYHPDQQAFDKLNYLLQNYAIDFGSVSFDIVFYDMMTPCTTCAQRIINDYRNLQGDTKVGELRIIYTRLYKNNNNKSIYYDPDGTNNLNQVLDMIADYNANAFPRPPGRSIRLTREDTL